MVTSDAATVIDYTGHRWTLLSVRVIRHRWRDEHRPRW